MHCCDLVLDGSTIHNGDTVVRMGIYGDNLASAIAQQLRAERAAAGYTYKELADKAGLTEQSVTRYLTEKREVKSAVLGALCDALEISPQELVTRAVERI